jgi:exodeoxyribonuclease V alpha subunit
VAALSVVQPASRRTGDCRSDQVIGHRRSALPGIDAAKSVPWVESNAGINLANSQREAVHLALSTKVLVITGGVGKTTLVNSILKILGVNGVRIALAAPTGRAVKRLSESTGLEARSVSAPRFGLAGTLGTLPLDAGLFCLLAAGFLASRPLLF